MKFAKFNRLFHRWASIAMALPVLVVIVTGLILLLQKDINWIQPPTVRGKSQELTLSFDEILKISTTVPEAGIKT